MRLGAIYARFGVTQGQLYMLRNAHGWKARGGNGRGDNPTKPKPRVRNYRKPPSPSGFDAAAQARKAREEEEKRQRKLYGDALEDARFLRGCGFFVTIDHGRLHFNYRPRHRRGAPPHRRPCERRLLKPEPAMAAAARQAWVAR